MFPWRWIFDVAVINKGRRRYSQTREEGKADPYGAEVLNRN